MQHRIAAIQMTSGTDIAENLQQAKKWIGQAAAEGAQLIILPEMFALFGIDQGEKIKIREEYGRGLLQDFLSREAAQHGVWLVGGTIPLATKVTPNKVTATCLVFDAQGNAVARYDKIHLFDVTVALTGETYHESATVLAGNEICVLTTPVGKLGLAVCYDIRFPEMFRAMQQQAVDVIVLPAAFTFTTGAAHWDVLLRARAIENQVYLLAAAQSGVHANGRKTYGHSMVVDPWGQVVACLPAEPGVVIAELDLGYLAKVRQTFPVLMHRRG